VGECFFWYRPTRVVPDQGPLNGCVRVCVCEIDNEWWDAGVVICLERGAYGPADATVTHSLLLQ